MLNMQCNVSESKIEENFPDTRKEVCSNSMVQRYLWEYNCLYFGLEPISDPDNRCRAETSLLSSCVLVLLEKTGIMCTYEDVLEVSQRPEVRAGILDSVEPGCAYTLNDTTCMRQYFIEGRRAEKCFTPIYHYQYLLSVKSLDEINEIRSSDSEHSLKCSLFQETLLCLLSSSAANSEIINCTTSDLAPALSIDFHIEYKIMFHFGGSGFPEIFYNECEASLTTQKPSGECPSPSSVADLVVAKCGAEVLRDMSGDQCRAYDTFIRCVEELYLPNGDLCPRDVLGYKWMALKEYTWYITKHLGGFDFISCKAERECYDLDTVTKRISKCDDNVTQLRTTLEDDTRCQLIEGLLRCISTDMAQDDLDCDQDRMERIVGELSEEWVQDWDWNFEEKCDKSKCSPVFVERARYEECYEPYYRLITAEEEMDRCRHFEGFLGCIKFHALLNNESCPIEKLDTLVRERTDMGRFSMCKVCEHQWTVFNDQNEVEGGVRIFLNPDGRSADIQFVSYNFKPASEWIGVGISHDQHMAQSDIYTASMNSSGHWIVTDRYADGKFKPQPDTERNQQNDVSDVTGYIDNDYVYVSFVRPISTDDVDRDISLESEIYLLFARGPLSDDGDIMYHSYRNISEKPFMFHCDPYSHFDANFPSDREEVCNNSFVQRHLWEYNCIDFNFTLVTNPDDRCRVELAYRGCVLSILEKSGIVCEEEDIAHVSQRPEVRNGLFDSIQPNCDLDLEEDSKCMKKFYLDTWRGAYDCFPPFYSLHELMYLKMENELDILSAKGNTSLKCSVYEETLSCFMRNAWRQQTVDAENINCTAADIAPALTNVAHIHYQVWSGNVQMWTDVDNLVAPEIKYLECEAAVNNSFYPEDCPTQAAVVDLVVAECSPLVLREITSVYDNPCLMLDTFIQCVKEIPLPVNDLCPEDYRWKSIEEYSSYISEHFVGFNLAECRIAAACKSLNYTEDEVLPYCKVQLDEFLDNAWKDGSCQYFDKLVDCVLDEMKSKQLPCNPYDVKETMITYTFSLTQYDWYYPNTCKRVHWVAELLFVNETYVPEMENNSSDVYKGFISQYSHLIGAVLSEFGGGHVKYLYNGSVVLGLNVWTVENPHNQVYTVLEDQFRADMVNVTVGKVYDDADQNQCLDNSFMKEIAIQQCEKELREVQFATDKCRPVLSLVLCIERILNVEGIYCHIDEIATVLSTDMEFGASALLSVMDLAHCKSLKCSPWFLEKALYDECAQMYRKMYSSDGDSCRHYNAFLGCIKYQALINDEECPSAELDEMLQRMKLRPAFVTIWCVDHKDLDDYFAINKSEICNSPAIVRGLVEYSCIKFNLTLLPDPFDQCRIELSIYGCVQAVLRNSSVMCSIKDIEQVVKHDEVRNGLLESIPRDCEPYLPASKCERDFYVQADSETQECFPALFTLGFLQMFTDVDNLISAGSNNTSLKCSLYEETLRCYMTNANVTETCPVTEIATALKANMDIYVTVLSSGTTFLGITGPSIQLGVTVDECDAYCPPEKAWEGLIGVCGPACSNDTDCTDGQICCSQPCGLICVDPLTSLPSNFTDSGCPSPAHVVDRVVAQCSASVLPGIRWYQMQPCHMYDAFKECLHTIYLPQDCPEDYVWQSVEEYSSHIANVIDGFHPVECKFAETCKNRNYIENEILPFCQDQLDVFQENIGDYDNCQNFDKLVRCVLEETESKQLHCNHDDVKEILVRYAYYISRYTWNYGDRCIRIQWVAALQFENETFVQEMYNHNSVRYRDFMKKYSHLISTILGSFGGGHIKYIYEGSVVLGLSFWTVGNPDNRLWTLLETEFGADLINITLTYVYRDGDQDRCFDSLYITDIVSTQCEHALSSLNSGADNCSAFSDLLGCVMRNLPRDDVDCKLETIVNQLTGWDSLVAVPVILQDFDFEHCKSLKCSVWYAEKASYEECYKSYIKINTTEEDYCRHYQDFLGCVKYHALMNDEYCPVAELDEMIQNVWTTSDLNMCINHEEFEILFPDTKSEVCYSSFVVRYLLEYECMEEIDISFLTDPLDLCRFEYSLHGCVHEILGRDVGCSMSDIAQITRRSEVRQGLLDSVPLDYCDANLNDSQCAIDFYTSTRTNGEDCIQNLGSLYYFGASFFYNIDELQSASGGKFKCSMYVETVRCFLSLENFTETCSPADIAPALRTVMNIYEQMLIKDELADHNVTQLNISLTECEAEAPEDFPTERCPSSSAVADTIVARCSGGVLYAIREYQFEPCMAYTGFTECLHQISLPDHCPADLIMSALEEHSAYISWVTDGFSFQECKSAATCKNLDYFDTEILPSCKDLLDVFLESVWEDDSCQNFDKLVSCVLDETESKQLYCNSDDVKDIMVSYAHSVSQYSWDYGDRCKRIQWVAEMRFENETFVQDMYNHSSVSYRDFMKKYSHFISTVLGRFGGGRIEYMYEGSVVLGLSFWTVENPEKRVQTLLSTEFSADLTNISLQYVYQDRDQNRCFDSFYIADIVSTQCEHVLLRFNSGADNCSAFSDLLGCITRNLSRDDVHCKFETLVNQLTGWELVATVSVVPQDFDLEYCKSLKCSVWYAEKVKHEECSKSYMKMNSTEEDGCRHYQDFLGCVKYHALINDEYCSVAELDEMIQNVWTTSDLNMCIDHEEYEILYPDTKSEVCNSSLVVRYLLEYECMEENDIRFLTDPLDRCRFEYSLHGCVHEILGRDVGCSMSDIEQITRRGDVRQGLLDSVTLDYCDANLNDSQCAIDFYTSTSTNGEECFQNLASLYYLGATLFYNVDDLPSSDGGKLKCSMFVEALRCFLDVGNFTETCSPADIAPALRTVMKIYEQMLVKDELADHNVTQLNISLSECDAEIPEEFPTEGCPSSSAVADTIVARCSGGVVYAIREYQVEPCMAYPRFTECLGEITLPDQCRSDLVMTAAEEHSTYISQVTDGFSFQECRVITECYSLMIPTPSDNNYTESVSVGQKCFYPFSYLIYADYLNMSLYDQCTAFKTFLSESEDCLLTYLPDFCHSSLSDIMEQELRYLTFTGLNVDKCQDFPPDPCSVSVLELHGWMKCIEVFSDFPVLDDKTSAPPQCRYISCFRDLAPGDCGYSNKDLDMYAAMAFMKMTGSQLPECPGDINHENCSALLSRPVSRDNHTEPQSVEDRCFGAIYYILTADPSNITDYEQCLILKTLLPEVKDCLLTSLPSVCNNSVDVFIKERLTYLSSASDFDLSYCEDVTANPCSVAVLGIQGLMTCYHVFSDTSSHMNSAPPNCRFRACFHNITPEECGFSDADIEIYAGSTFQRFTGYPLPECPVSDIGNCSDLIRNPPSRDDNMVSGINRPSERQSVEEICLSSLYSLLHVNSQINMTETEICSIFIGLWLEMEICMSTNLPDYCAPSVNAIIQQRLYALDTEGYDVALFAECTDTGPDPCLAVDVQGLMKCYHILKTEETDGSSHDETDIIPDHCRYRACFHDVAPRQCGLSDVEIDVLANTAFQRLTEGPPLPQCTDIQQCIAQLDPRSSQCLSPMDNMSQLIRLSEEYPGSSFQYGLNETCGLLKIVFACLRDHFTPNNLCQSLAWTMLEDIYTMAATEWKMDFTLDQCQGEESIDECESVELFILLQCHQYVPYSCNFQRCVGENLQKVPQCSSSVDPEATAAAIYNTFTGNALPPCYGLVVPCDLSGCTDVMYATCIFTYCQCDENSYDEGIEGGRLPLCVKSADPESEPEHDNTEQ